MTTSHKILIEFPDGSQRPAEHAHLKVDCEAFERTTTIAAQSHPLRLLSDKVLKHTHLKVLYTYDDGQPSLGWTVGYDSNGVAVKSDRGDAIRETITIIAMAVELFAGDEMTAG